MNIPRLIVVWSVILLNNHPLLGQLQEAGTSDYALANSSVAWIPRSSSLFLNPGELARLHQNDFNVSSGRFRSVASMSGDMFVPFVGTFGLGVAPDGNSTLYSAGFGRLVYKYSTIGGAVSILTNVRGGFRFSLGTALHMPSRGEESGWHVGVSVMNLPVRGIANAGVGYWILPARMRVQFATQTRITRAVLARGDVKVNFATDRRAEFLGGEVKVSEKLSLQAGVRGFKYGSAGFSYSTPYAVAELAAGSKGLSFSVNIRFGDAASYNHRLALGQAKEAYIDGRYSGAQRLFATSVEFDEYDEYARARARRTKVVMDASIAALLKQADAAVREDDYPAAMKAYGEILRMDPSESGVATQRANVGTKFRSYIDRLLASGDSLLNRKELAAARRFYEQVLDTDPDNDTASERIDQLNVLSKKNVRASLGRARSYLKGNRLDDAQREFEMILAAEPNNSRAREGLNAVRSRRVNAQLEEAKTAFNEQNYFDALTMLLDVLQKESGNEEAQTYLEKTRDALRAEIDPLFKRGLQFYIKEDYKSAISEWDKALLIQPTDSTILEYRKRAADKLKALEQLK